MVPSHTKGETNESGFAELARRLAQNNRIDKVNYLIRNKTNPLVPVFAESYGSIDKSTGNV